MAPDDLLCSRNARSRTPLVVRAQWKINQPPSLRERASLEGIYVVRRAHSRIDQAALWGGGGLAWRGKLRSGLSLVLADRAQNTN